MDQETAATPAEQSTALNELDALVARRRQELGITAEQVAARKDRADRPPWHELAERLTKGDPVRDQERAEADRLRTAQELRQHQETDWQNVLAGAGSRYAKCRLHNYRIDAPEKHRRQQIAALDRVRAYVENLPERMKAGEGLVLFGTVGTGKDHLAVAIARAAIAQRYRAAWLNGLRWFADLRDAIEEETPERRSLAAVTVPDLLVISDPLPTVGELTPYQAGWLYRLADARSSNGKVTVVTVNVANDDEADRRIGEAAWDRLCDRSWKIHFGWPSSRNPATKTNCE